MRSPREVAFRLRQETRNLLLWCFPPEFRGTVASPLRGLPSSGPVVDTLRETRFAQEVCHLADKILAHRFPIFDSLLDTGPAIEWRRDYLNQKTAPTAYFRLIPYLDIHRAGDHKYIWELNRHQHLVLLAQAFLFRGNQAYLDELLQELRDWQQQNSFQQGINWCSALEVAFRAFSWIWIYHLIGSRMPDGDRMQFLGSLYQHGLHIETNLSFYFSPNTHLLGEAVVLHALGHLIPEFPSSSRWRKLGANTVDEQMDRQVRADGSHFEQSTYYHVYALDMLLFHAILRKPSPKYAETLSRMADFLHTLLGAERTLPFLGDDDGGRWFHPYGPRDQFGRATLATCSLLLNRSGWTYETADLHPQASWWLGQTEGTAKGKCTSCFFPNSGLAVFQDERCRVIVDAGPFGPGRAGHSHSDTLSVIASVRGKPVLIDCGTFTYIGSEEERNAFRGSSAHNTVRINGRDQATPVGPFQWDHPPAVHVISYQDGYLEAEWSNDGFRHTRVVEWKLPGQVVIHDRIEGPPGEYTVEQFWHLASDEASRYLHFDAEPERRESWHSPVFGQKQRIPCLVVKRHTTLPATFTTTLDWTSD